MAVTDSSFRSDFPEFASKVVYPVSAVSFWANMASQLLNQNRFGGPAASGQPNTIYDTAYELFIAHNLVLEAKAQAEAKDGAPPGLTTGPVASESVDKVSVNYDVAAGIEEGAGHWNLTIYGTRLKRMFDMFGAGGLQIGSCGASAGGIFPYAGPWTSLYPNPSG